MKKGDEQIMTEATTTRRMTFAGIEGELTGDISIDVQSIPEHVRNDLARFALALVEDVFAQPSAEEKYQKWLKERKRRQRAQKKGANNDGRMG